MWEGELEARSRKALQKQLPFPCEQAKTNEKQSSHTQRTPDLQISSSLFPQLAALKLDPDLDGNPPFHPSAPPPYNSTTPNERRETDSTMPQQKTNSEAAHPEVPVPPQNSTTDTSDCT